MEDAAIIDLYFKRSEHAVSETKIKYGRMIFGLSLGILKNEQDAEECENDTYYKTWETVPPTRPNILSAFLSKIARNLSLNRYERRKAEKRGGGEIPLLLDELAECIPDHNSMEDHMDGELVRDILNRFLDALREDARIVFMRRYWFGDSVQEISERTGYGVSKIKMSLLRSRRELKKQLEKEEYFI